VCVTPIIYGGRFRRGSFTNPDAALRREAVELSAAAVEAASVLGAGYVKFWPGQDGYDYPFQCDYGEYRRLATEGVRSVASSFPETRFGIEYKLKEPRNRLFWSSAAATLLAIDQIGLDNIGVVIDFGHSLVDIELDDNYREWDDDLTVGSVHLVETLEFLLMMRTIGWGRPVKLDLFPFRENAVAAVQASIETLRQLEERCDRLDIESLRRAQQDQDAISAQRVARAALLG
jgi:xylose isomerase